MSCLANDAGTSYRIHLTACSNYECNQVVFAEPTAVSALVLPWLYSSGVRNSRP